jgi:hypothetical protein
MSIPVSEYKWTQFLDLPIPVAFELPIAGPFYTDRFYNGLTIGAFVSMYAFGRDITNKMTYVEGGTNLVKLLPVGMQTLCTHVDVGQKLDFYQVKHPEKEEPLTPEEKLKMTLVRLKNISFMRQRPPKTCRITIARLLLKHILGRRSWGFAYPNTTKFDISSIQGFDLCVFMEWYPIPEYLYNSNLVISNID